MVDDTLAIDAFFNTFILFLTKTILKGLTPRKIVFYVCVCALCFIFVYGLIL